MRMWSYSTLFFCKITVSAVLIPSIFIHCLCSWHWLAQAGVCSVFITPIYQQVCIYLDKMSLRLSFFKLNRSKSFGLFLCNGWFDSLNCSGLTCQAAKHHIAICSFSLQWNGRKNQKRFVINIIFPPNPNHSTKTATKKKINYPRQNSAPFSYQHWTCFNFTWSWILGCKLEELTYFAGFLKYQM